jgi:plasmid stability protein
MATLVVKNFPAELHARLKLQAARHHRSVAKEVVHLIEIGMGGHSQNVMPEPIRLTDGYRPSVEEVEAAIAEGRD